MFTCILLLYVAMMSMEEEKMAAAKTGLEEVEKKCRVNNSIFKVYVTIVWKI